MSRARSASSRLLAFLGLLGGAALLGWALFDAAPPAAPPQGAVASVNGVPLSAEVYDAAVDGLTDATMGLDRDTAEAQVLARLIDEELLLQKALDLDLIRSDRLLRAALVQAVIALILRQNLNLEPEEGELEAFYAENIALFTRAERLRLAYLFLPLGAEEVAERLTKKLAAGESFAIQQKQYMPTPPVPLPDLLLPPSSLAAYLGADLVEQALAMPEGGISGPFIQPDGIYFLHVLERGNAGAPDFAEVRDDVLQRWRRAQDDGVLRRNLDELRREANILTRPKNPPQ